MIQSMSLRHTSDDKPTAGRYYRAAFQYYNKARRDEEERRQRNAEKARRDEEERRQRNAERARRAQEDRRLAVLPTTPPEAPQTRTNPWTPEDARALWGRLVPQNAATEALTLAQFMTFLDAGGVELRKAFQLPDPKSFVQRRSIQGGAVNQTFVIKLWNLVSKQGTQPFNRAAFVAFLTAPPDKDPLERVLATNQFAPGQNELPSLARLSL